MLSFPKYSLGIRLQETVYHHSQIDNLSFATFQIDYAILIRLCREWRVLSVIYRTYPEVMQTEIDVLHRSDALHPVCIPI